ncbi:DUF6542 domain-containing protein [Mycolicibacterium tusciae]|uniref:DUF6542 domain-containing protein n=1 Tax=Mycolicibacterium tusciae TaxID=75922 RepID=A0A1X0JP46_9MYCO|nr:DUF6542 domain-containing protein [Mycolicibacterium tusciae]ORB64345.1 hypothetical protein BST47_17385 [Mycolicibacterium tusciae]
MSAQRARSAVAADHRSVHPNIPGVPWWGAVLIAATLMAVGFAYDAGSGAKELTSVFAGTYVVGCIFAVLAVRQSGVFTAVIQPPLLLFGAVPSAYFVFTDSTLSNFKDTLINCAYPLIERFPLMFFTSAVVLLIGMARWYTGMSARRGAPAATDKDETSKGGLGAAVSAKVSALLAGLGSTTKAEDADEPPRRRTGAERPSRASGRSGRPASRTAPPRSRHARPPESDYEPGDRRRRPRPSRQAEPPMEPPRRKPRSGSSQRRATPPPERRSGYERPARRRRYDDDPPLHGSNGSGTHHPVSRVRYRGSEDGDDYAQYRRPPRSRDRAVESWEYDI